MDSSIPPLLFIRVYANSVLINRAERPLSMIASCDYARRKGRRAPRRMLACSKG